jgi:hypothetical protein
MMTHKLEYPDTRIDGSIPFLLAWAEQAPGTHTQTRFHQTLGDETK